MQHKYNNFRIAPNFLAFIWPERKWSYTTEKGLEIAFKVISFREKLEKPFVIYTWNYDGNSER